MYGFNFKVAGILAGITSRLETITPAITVAPYLGELDKLELEQESPATLSLLVADLPMYLVAYADGVSNEESEGAWLNGDERSFTHDCDFTIVCCAMTWEMVSTMIDNAIRVVTGKRFIIMDQPLDDDNEPVGEPIEVVLNFAPLKPSERPPSIEYVLRRDEITVYAVHFQTSFSFDVARDVDDEGVTVETIIVNMSVLTPSRNGARGVPGVEFAIAGEEQRT